MDKSLLHYYEKELNYLQKSAARFAEENPNAASKLKINADSIDDPHIERLIQAVSFLNGRIRKKLDDDFPELSDSLLSILSPASLRPVPSMGVVRLSPQSGLTEEYILPKGSMLETEPVNGEPINYQLAYPVSIWPFFVQNIELIEGAYMAPSAPVNVNPCGIIRITLKTDAEDIHFSSQRIDKLRFFLRGSNSVVNRLYETITNKVCAIAIADDSSDKDASFMGPDNIKPVGFEKDELILNRDSKAFEGYSLLTEYFTFPQKFHFVDIEGLGSFLNGRKDKLELYLYLDRPVPELSGEINRQTLALNCAPVINLFKQTIDPIRISDREYEYHIQADVRNKLHKEIFSLDSVTAISEKGERLPLKPYYGFNHLSSNSKTIYWQTNRRTPDISSDKVQDKGSEMFFSLLDENYLATSRHKWVLQMEATCINRDLPSRLPVGGGQPFMKVRDGGLIEKIECIVTPTPTLRPGNSDGKRWRLISHLGLGNMPLFKNEHAVEQFTELLKLYDFKDSPANQAVISSISRLSYRQIASRVRTSHQSALCRGVEVSLTIDTSLIKDQSAFLLGAVLERFFSLSAPINSFTRLVLINKQKKQLIKKWKPRVPAVAI